MEGKRWGSKNIGTNKYGETSDNPGFTIYKTEEIN